MRRWVLPTLFATVAVFCLLVATWAALDRQWYGVAVPAVVGLRLALLATQTRRDS